MSAYHSDGDLAWKISHGRGAMPAWKSILKSKQIWDLVNFIRRLGDS
jgi:mono/diheme cytochrome c family protein